MPIKDLLKKRDKIKDDALKNAQATEPPHSAPEFTFMRSDTNTQELIQPPSFPDEHSATPSAHEHHTSKLVSRFRSSSNASTASRGSSKGEKRLSQKLHLRSSSRASSSSSIIPEDLPVIENAPDGSEEKEAKWEERATILAKENPNTNHPAAVTEETGGLRSRGNSSSRPKAPRSISDAKGDVRAWLVLLERGAYRRLGDDPGSNQAT